jgi:alkyl hydroperoxide reductase subunit AhpF
MCYNTNMTYELIIIGGGPAGCSAAVYAARKKLKTLLITSEWGGQSIVSETIYNWIGTPEISGHDLAESFKKHVEYYQGEDLELKTGSYVEKVEKISERFKVSLSNGESFETKTILISSGSGRRKIEVKGADVLEHKGLTYCATCDGPLFSGQDVAVIGGGNAAFESASQLAQYCKSVTIIHRGSEWKAEAVTVEKILARPNVKSIMNADTTEVYGEKFVAGMKYKDKEGNEHDLPVTGIFVEIGQIPNTGIVEGVVQLDDYKRIKIDYATQKTNTPGIWAAGDCTNVLYHQNNIAAGDAVRALEDIYKYLHA